MLPHLFEVNQRGGEKRILILRIMNKTLIVFLTCALSPLLAFADENLDALKTKAEKGDAEAQVNLAGCYAKGIGVVKDQTKAVEWFKKAADQGNAKAQASLGLHYLLFPPNDYQKAAELFQKAAIQGVDIAQAYLGICFHEGFGVAKDGVKAIGWFQKAAAQGLDVAQHALAKCYLEGTGCTKNDVKAHVWLTLYAAQEHSFVAPNQNQSIRETISMIEKRMTPEQIAEARNLSGTYAELIKHGKPIPAP